MAGQVTTMASAAPVLTDELRGAKAAKPKGKPKGKKKPAAKKKAPPAKRPFAPSPIASAMQGPQGGAPC